MDRGQLAELLPAYRGPLLRYTGTMARDHATAEDLAQETMARALERCETLSGPEALRGWLYRIAHNLAIDHYRALREQPYEDISEQVESRWHDEEYTVDAAVVAARSETADELRDALVRLPVGYRTVVVLHDAEGWTSPEIAEALQLGVPATKQRLRRGRMMLVSALAAGHERRVATRGVPLRCWDARQHISSYIDGEAAPELSRVLERHLADCPTCPPLYASLVSARGAVAGLAAQHPLRDPDSVVPQGVAERIRAAGPGTRPGRAQ